MNEIVTNLWLGAYPAIDDAPHLLSTGIRFILTVDVQPLVGLAFDCFERKFICLRDEPSQDVLDILDEALDFVDSSLRNGAILVHCAMGVSRSATIVIAYLMRKFRVSYDSALGLVMKKRTVYPNVGFVNQLKLFEVMKWTVDKQSPVYRQYAAIRKFKGEGAAYDESREQEINKPQPKHQLAIFKCRKCRRRLFSSANLVSHCKPERAALEAIADSIQSDEDDGEINRVLIKGITLNDSMVPCTLNELFTDPLDWTRPYTHEVEGKLYCPGCQAKVGSFNWCGEPCVCGTWVTPAFHFNRNHLDRTEPRQLASTATVVETKESGPLSSSASDPARGDDRSHRTGNTTMKVETG